MSYSFSASGAVDQVRQVLTQQAEQYADDAVEHVRDFLHNLAGKLDQGGGVTVSASGHSDGSMAGGQFSVNALPAPVSSDTPAPEAGGVS